jgi:hypothetical protein
VSLELPQLLFWLRRVWLDASALLRKMSLRQSLPRVKGGGEARGEAGGEAPLTKMAKPRLKQPRLNQMKRSLSPRRELAEVDRQPAVQQWRLGQQKL